MKFHEAYCVNLDRRPDRWREFAERWLPMWPNIQRFSAIDSQVVTPPSWWSKRTGGPAWGCYRSHLQLIEMALSRRLESILLLEDDAVPCEGFFDKVDEFLEAVDPEWEILYLGGQHLHAKKHPPLKVREGVFSPYNVNRTHAWAVSSRGLQTVYNHLLRRDWTPGHHIDWHMGRLVQRRENKIFCPEKWLVAQAEGISDIQGRKFPERFFPAAVSYPQVTVPYTMVLGLHASGSSCLAGVLHHLGIVMGDEFAPCAQDKNGGGFEAKYLAKRCEELMPFPSRTADESKIGPTITKWMRSRKGNNLGMKYPHLCYFAQFLPETRIVSIKRDLETSIESLQRREPHRCPKSLDKLQRMLWAEREKYLDGREHIEVSYDQMIEDPEGTVSRLVEALELNPTQSQRDKAVAHIRPREALV